MSIERNKGDIWLAADYHFPTVYSCRIPMTSMSSALALPTPGPSTVRLAIIRAGVELFGIEDTRKHLFPTIRSMSIHIRPPERVAFSNHTLHAYKDSHPPPGIKESLMYREVAHATGTMAIYIRIPKEMANVYTQLLAAIGYWGKADSLACCVQVQEQAPVIEECSRPIQSLDPAQPISQLFAAVAADFAHPHVTWEQMISSRRQAKKPVLALNVFVWPMVMAEQQHMSKLLLRCSILSNN